MGRAATARLIAALLFFGAACSSGTEPAPTATTTPDPTPTPTATPAPRQSDIPPLRDLIDLAKRFRGLPADTPETARTSPYNYALGDSEEMLVLNLDGPSLQSVTVSVRAITDHAYFFVQDGVRASEDTLDRIGTDFEETVYPAVTAAFGEERSPGVDADPRISIVHADLRGAGGYFTSADQVPRAVSERSNEREAVYLKASVLSSPGTVYNALLAHELQHLINWSLDPDEESWVNEGLSQLAAEAVGGGTGTIPQFLIAPDNQLTFWPPGGGLHYGESHLFVRYLLNRFGGRGKAAALTSAPGHGVTGIDAYLEGFGTTFDDVFADWLIANLLDEPSGPYAHEGADLRVSLIQSLSSYSDGQGSVEQFAADYLEVVPPAGGGVFTFDGSDQVGVGIERQDGAFWWSNEGDSIDSRLTREFDLTGLDSATLRFRISFDTELGWDYAYVAASADGGETWTALPGLHTSEFDTVGHAYGPGYTGSSDGLWLQEEIDLTDYAGGELLLRFEYITDDATYGRGFAVDDVEIAELGFVDGGGGQGWLIEGFRLIAEPFPQRFLVQVVERDGATRVSRPELDEGNTLEIEVDGPVTIVVSAMTHATTDAATYRWALRQP